MTSEINFRPIPLAKFNASFSEPVQKQAKLCDINNSGDLDKKELGILNDVIKQVYTEDYSKFLTISSQYGFELEKVLQKKPEVPEFNHDFSITNSKNIVTNFHVRTIYHNKSNKTYIVFLSKDNNKGSIPSGIILICDNQNNCVVEKGTLLEKNDFKMIEKKFPYNLSPVSAYQQKNKLDELKDRVTFIMLALLNKKNEESLSKEESKAFENLYDYIRQVNLAE